MNERYVVIRVHKTDYNTVRDIEKAVADLLQRNGLDCVEVVPQAVDAFFCEQMVLREMREYLDEMREICKNEIAHRIAHELVDKDIIEWRETDWGYGLRIVGRLLTIKDKKLEADDGTE